MIFQARSSGGNFQAGDDFLFGFRQGVRQGDFSGEEGFQAGSGEIQAVFKEIKFGLPLKILPAPENPQY